MQIFVRDIIIFFLCTHLMEVLRIFFLMDRVKDDSMRLKDGADIEDAEDREGWRALVEAAKRLNGALSKRKKKSRIFFSITMRIYYVRVLIFHKKENASYVYYTIRVARIHKVLV